MQAKLLSCKCPSFYMSARLLSSMSPSSSMLARLLSSTSISSSSYASQAIILQIPLLLHVRQAVILHVSLLIHVSQDVILHSPTFSLMQARLLSSFQGKDWLSEKQSQTQNIIYFEISGCAVSNPDISSHSYKMLQVLYLLPRLFCMYTFSTRCFEEVNSFKCSNIYLL